MGSRARLLPEQALPKRWLNVVFLSDSNWLRIEQWLYSLRPAAPRREEKPRALQEEVSEGHHAECHQALESSCQSRQPWS